MEQIFLVINRKKAINLANVSNIIFNHQKNKISFQFANSIDILGKITSDFYDIEPDEKPFEYIKKEILKIPYIKENFLIPQYNNNEFFEIVNINHINTITLNEPNKIIFNMDYAIEIFDKKTNQNKKISKFVYWKYKNPYDKGKELKKIFQNKGE